MNQLNTFSYFKIISFNSAIILYQITEVKNNAFTSLGIFLSDYGAQRCQITEVVFYAW